MVKRKAWLSVAVLAVVLALLLFIPAGTIDYWQAWLFLAVFVGASALTTADLVKRDPMLLERRMRGGPMAETREAQRVIMLFTSFGYIAIMIVPALDRRYGWSHVPAWLSIVANCVVALGFFVVRRVYRENTYAAATIRVEANQKVISTGPYAVVRHPMYAGAALYLIATPIALGSVCGLIAVAATLPFLIWRLVDEERLLEQALPGYTEYQRRVRHRIVPFIW